MKKTVVGIFILGVFISSFFCLNLAAFELVSNTCPQTVIIVPEKPSETADFAAAELQKYIEKATGTKLQIVKDNETIPPVLNKIYIGETRRTLQNGLVAAELPDNSCRIKIDKNEMFLYGRDGNAMMPKNGNAATWKSQLGTLYAVYDVLDRELGVRWLWPGENGTYVPRTENIVFKTDSDRIITPKLLFSRLRVAEVKDTSKTHWSETDAWLMHHRFGQYTNPNYGHAFTQYWKRFGQTHPEWFAMKPDGTRGPVDARIELVQMCVSNPELHKQIVADWLKSRTPDKPWINCAENDKREIDLPCLCKNCQAWDSEDKLVVNDKIWAPDTATGTKNIQSARHEKSLSDRYAKFYLAVQEEAKKYDNNARIVAYAYAGYTQPPTVTTLNENVNVWIVPPYYFPLSSANKNEFRNLWDGWRKAGCRLVLRPNYFWGGYCMPYIFADDFGKEFKYAQENGLIATDFDSLTSMWGTQGPNLYMLGRLHARPDLTVDQVLDEYYSAFGKGKEAIKNYFSLWNDITAKAKVSSTYGGWLFKYADEIYTLQDIEKGQELLNQALLATDGDRDAAGRVAFLNKGLEHTRLLIDAIKKGKSWRDNPFDIEKTKLFEQSITTLYDFRKKIEGDFVINSLLCKNNERLDFIDKSYFHLMLRTCAGRMPLENWLFKWQKPETAVDIKAVETEDLSSWLHIDTDKTWAAQADKITFDGGQENVGWYRTRFSLPDDQQTPYNYICIMFGGVDKSATVWLNDEKKLERVFYSRLDPDMWQSPFFIVLKKTECKPDNSLIVRVQGRIQGGGIWKSVYLIWYR